MHVSEIRVKRIRVNQGLGVLSYPITPSASLKWCKLPSATFEKHLHILDLHESSLFANKAEIEI